MVLCVRATKQFLYPPIIFPFLLLASAPKIHSLGLLPMSNPQEINKYPPVFPLASFFFINISIRRSNTCFAHAPQIEARNTTTTAGERERFVSPRSNFSSFLFPNFRPKSRLVAYAYEMSAFKISRQFTPFAKLFPVISSSQ